MRKKIVAGNWKMNKTYSEAIPLLYGIKDNLFRSQNVAGVLKIIAPPYPYLHDFYESTKGIKNFYVAAQNCSSEESGAFTGEVSAAMIKSVGAQYVILGHSERRQYFNESEQDIMKKVDLALKHDLIPIVCTGENSQSRKENRQFEIVSKQLSESLFHLSPEQFAKIIIAYEPIWAIGTGLTATTAQVQEMHHSIRSFIETKYGSDIAGGVSILYGGSCNVSNSAELFSCSDVDGGLIGGASLKAEDFSNIIRSFPS